MIGRFSDLPERLRATTLRMASRATVDFGLWNEHSNVTLDAALKIEALERDLARAAPSPETLAKVKEVAQSLLAAYDRETFMRSADCHPDTCECSRCGFDRLRAALDKETDR